jgi:DNA replication and repair protein RecF
MRLDCLEIRNIRILTSVEVAPGEGLNVFVGPNGSGKTSILEAIHLLGSGRSFRTHRLTELISRGQSLLRARGDFRREDGSKESIGVERGPEGLRIRVAAEVVRNASELARRLPLVAITPDSQRLLTDGAVLRRQLMDWALFHVEPTYLTVLQRYRRALRQRNAALRDGAGSNALAPWDQEVGEAGEALHHQRDRFLQEILPLYAETLKGLISLPVDIRYQAGWDTSRDLTQTLGTMTAKDRVRGFTGVGPHRADLRFSTEGVLVSQVLSRGEGKLFVVGMVLAQAEFLYLTQGRRPIVLVDDLASELDAESRGRFFAQLRSLGAQIFVTTVSRNLVEKVDWEGMRMFHVERDQSLKMVSL